MVRRTAGAWFVFVSLAACSEESPGGGGTGPAGGSPNAGVSGGGASAGTLGGGGAGGAATGGAATGGTGTGGAMAGSGGVAAGTGGTPSGAGGTTSGSGGGAGESGSGGAGAGSGGASAGAGGSDAGASGAGAGSGGAAGAGGAGGSGPSTCPFTPPTLPTNFPQNWTAEPVTVFNDDGAWTWYSDERVVIDAERGKLLVSSDANGGQRNGNVDVVIHDLASKQNDRFVLGDLGPDDHNVGAVLVKGPGSYLVAWAGHNENCNTYWRNYSGSQWSQPGVFDWRQHSAPCPWTASQRSVTYNNLWSMSAEGKIYNLTRTVDTSPNLLISDDGGQTWEYGGRLTSTPQVGYVAGYYKFWGNQVDRIDFIGTEAHPRDNNNSLYHGYIKGGRVYNSTDTVVDDNLHDTNAREITNYTPVFRQGTQVNGLTLNYLWNIDLVRYADGTIAALWKARVNGQAGQSNPDHRMLYSRFDGQTWRATYLGKAGPKLYDSEQDYIGLAALDPDDPHVIYISTPIDPRDDNTNLGQHEIWKGVSCDDGQSFEWTPITMNSSVDNLRPVVPKWDAENTALLWFRGTYQTAQIYDAEVVGIVTKR